MAEAQRDSKAIFERLSKTHPDFLAWQEEWERYRDCLGDELEDKSRYLPKAWFEPDKEYQFRLKISEFIPESGLAVERILGALFNEKPKRELKGHEKDLEEFLENADRKGNSWNAVVEEIAFHLLGYGVTRTLVTVPPVQFRQFGSEEGRAEIPQEVTRAIEQELKIRPYVINYTPLSVIDWEVDNDGKLKMVRIREEYTISNNSAFPAGRSHFRAIRFIEFTTIFVTWWDFYENDKGGWDLVGEDRAAHGLGVVPMVSESIREIKPFIGQSFIRYSSRADIQKMRAESDLAYDTYIHAHPVLAVWTEDELGQVGVGSNTYLKLDPGSGGGAREDARYLEAPTSAFDALHRVIEEKRGQIFRQAKIDPMAIASAGASSIFQASGAARAWSFGTSEARMLSKIADKMEQIERKVLDLVLRYQTAWSETLLDPEEMLFKGTIQYPEEFDLASTAQLLDETEQIAGLINSPTLLRVIHKRIAASKVGDTTAKILSKIQKEIDENPLLNTQITDDKAPKRPSIFAFPPNVAGPGKEPEDELDDEESGSPGEGGQRGEDQNSKGMNRKKRNKKR